MPDALELLAQAEALIAALVAERDQRALVLLPPQGASLRAIERAALVQALERCYWVQRPAAQLLGISDRVMSHKVAKHRICRPHHYGRRWESDDPRRSLDPPA